MFQAGERGPPARGLVPVQPVRQLPVQPAARVAVLLPDFHRGVGLPRVRHRQDQPGIPLRQGIQVGELIICL